MRSGLKPTGPSRHSPSKLPPVRVGWGTTTPPLFTSVSNLDWTIEMVRGTQLKTGTKMPVASRKSPSKSFVNDEPRTSSSQILPKQEESTIVASPQNDMGKEIEVGHISMQLGKYTSKSMQTSHEKPVSVLIGILKG